MTRFGTVIAAISAAAASAPLPSSARVLRGLALRQADDGSGPKITVPDYSDEQCQTWLAGVLAADSDGSGGLSEEEFHDFLQDVDDPPYIESFFDKHSDSYLALPWLFKVAHKSLACRCTDLGMGEGCCSGEGAEISFVGLRNDEKERQSLTPQQLEVAAEYRADMCNSVAAVFEEAIETPAPTKTPTTEASATPAPTTRPVEPGTPTGSPVTSAPVTSAPVTSAPVTAAPVPAPPCGPGTEGGPCPPADDGLPGLDVVGSVLDYSSFDYSEIFSRRRLEIPQYFNASAIEMNEESNDILANVINGFNKLQNKLASEEGNLRGLRSLQKTGQLKPVVVSDIACPDGLVYAPKDAFCLNFALRFEETAPEMEDRMNSLITSLKESISKGDLYFTIKEEYPETLIKGMGSPGGGVNYRASKPDATIAAEVATTDEPESSGLGAGAIVIIILCVVCIPMAVLAMYSRKKKVDEEERMQRLAEYNAKRDLEARQAPEEVPAAIAEEVDSSDDDSIVDVYDEDKVAAARSTPGSSLAAMGAAGAAATMPRSAPKKDKKEEDNAEIRRSVVQLVEETKAPKTADELLTTYAGREEELVSHLTKMKSKQSKSTRIRELVEETKAPKNADELLAAYTGREDELLAHLEKMKSRQDKKAEVAALVAKTNPGKSAEELLTVYAGREDELIKNLNKMEAGKMRASQLESTKASIRKLVDETDAPKSADELLATYTGREEELMKNLEKMKSKQQLKTSQRASVRALVDETKPGKSAEELLATYDGREDQLIKNLEKMKSKQQLKASQTASVRALVEETGAPKSAEELLATYAGREDELIKNLEKMKSKRERQSLKSQKAESVRALVDETKPGKSAEDLLSLYDGKEDELIKNLEKMKAKQQSKRELLSSQTARVRALVDETKPGKTADELLSSFAGREEDLIKNLEKMKAKQQREAERESLKSSKAQSVRQLVDETKPGKSAEELLSMYDGKEDDLIKNLEKMKSKQQLKASKQASVRALVDETLPGKSAEELLAMYDGKEDQLIKNLEKMKSKSLVKDKANKQQSVRELVDETNPGKSAEELLIMYDGKEDELIKNLERMKAKQNKVAAKEMEAKAEKRKTITALVEETNPGKSAEELLDAYSGKEDELLKNLAKMKSKKDMKVKKEKQSQVVALVEATNPGKSADELLAAYDGKEDELIKNLTKMKTKQEMKASKQKSVKIVESGGDDGAAMRRMVESLVAETRPGKSADDLLRAYEGREEELVAHLKKLKKSKRNLAS